MRSDTDLDENKINFGKNDLEIAFGNKITRK